jgi:hypothetical protein
MKLEGKSDGGTVIDCGTSKSGFSFISCSCEDGMEPTSGI